MNSLSQIFTFIRAYLPSVSKVWTNSGYSLLTIQVKGIFTDLDLVVEGRLFSGNNDSENWTPLYMLDRSSRQVIQSITEGGIYQTAIDGIDEIRVRVASISGGYVIVSGVYYDNSDGSIIPDKTPNPLTEIPAQAIVKGIGCTMFIDPQSGNIVGYDTLATEQNISAISNYPAIEGGFGNKLTQIIPDSAKITGNYTSQAFSLESLSLATGAVTEYNAIVPYCEYIEAVETTLTVSKEAVAFGVRNDADCYIVEPKEEADGKAYQIINNEIQGFTATIGTTYRVMYRVHSPSSKQIAIPDRWNPRILTVMTRFGVYTLNRKNKSSGTFTGWLFFIVPRAIFDGSTSSLNFGSQTENAKTVYQWVAIGEKVNAPQKCCKGVGEPLGYYLYVPCGEHIPNVTAITVIGNGLHLEAGKSDLLPIKYVLADGTLIQPAYNSLAYSVDDETIAKITSGIVTGVSEGETDIHIYGNDANGESITAICHIVVSGTINRGARVSHITII